MRKRLPTFISSLSLLILVIIQIYIINSYYKIKSKNFDMTYSKAILSTINDNNFDYSIDSLNIVLNEFASSYFIESLDSLDLSLQKNILARFESSLQKHDSNPAKIKQYLIANNLDTAFKTYYVIKEISFINFDDRISVYKSKQKLKPEHKTKGLFIKSYYKEGNYYAIEYDYFIDFTHKRKVIFSEMKGLLLMVILTITAVISTFVYTLLTLQRQKKLSELKDDFINNVTHEFKTPLSIISVATASLKHHQLRNDAQKSMEICTILEKQNKLLSKMIDNVIDISLLDQKLINQDKETVLLKEFISELISSFLNNETAGKKVQIHEGYSIPDNFKYTLDPIQFSRTLNNLLNNSVKYCEHDPVIKVRVLLDNHLKIEIEDNGIGIKEEHNKDIFNKFFRVDSQIKAKGLGLGLYIVKRFVENNNGSIQIESIWGNGTIVTITLPK